VHTKAEVLAWRAGQPFRREASVHLIQEGVGYEVEVDLRAGTVTDWNDSPGQNYMWTSGDDEAVSELMLAHPEVQAALERRGVADLTHVECFSMNEGYFDQPEERGNRVVRAVCSEGHGRFTGYGGIFEGLVAVVGSGVGHRQDARAGVLELEVLVVETITVDRLAARAVTTGEVASLAHEARDHAVGLRAGIAAVRFLGERSGGPEAVMTPAAENCRSARCGSQGHGIAFLRQPIRERARG
jgi:hypothetical protein